MLSNCGTWYKGKSFSNENLTKNITSSKKQEDNINSSEFYLPVINAEDLIQKVATDNPLVNEDDKADDEEDSSVLS